MNRSLAEAAECLVDRPFRLCGRDPATGLDCLGVVLAALAAIGRYVQAPADYSLRHLGPERFLPLAARAGLTEQPGAPLSGDVLLLRPAPAQLHLAIVGTGSGIVHAHAGLGRIVFTPFPLPWPLLRQWRLLPPQAF